MYPNELQTNLLLFPKLLITNTKLILLNSIQAPKETKYETKKKPTLNNKKNKQQHQKATINLNTPTNNNNQHPSNKKRSK